MQGLLHTFIFISALRIYPTCWAAPQSHVYVDIITRHSGIFLKWVWSDLVLFSGKRVRRRDTFLEGEAEDVSPQARRIWAQTCVAGTADEQDPAAVPEPPGGQRAPSKAAAIGEGLSNQRHHQQVISVKAELQLAETRLCRLLFGFLYVPVTVWLSLSLIASNWSHTSCYQVNK